MMHMHQSKLQIYRGRNQKSFPTDLKIVGHIELGLQGSQYPKMLQKDSH